MYFQHDNTSYNAHMDAANKECSSQTRNWIDSQEYYNQQVVVQKRLTTGNNRGRCRINCDLLLCSWLFLDYKSASFKRTRNIQQKTGVGETFGNTEAQIKRKWRKAQRIDDAEQNEMWVMWLSVCFFSFWKLTCFYTGAIVQQ